LRVFDKDEDDHLSIMELKKVLTTMGQRMKKKEFEEMIKSASIKENGLIHIQDFCSFLLHGKKKKSPCGRWRGKNKENTGSKGSIRSGSFSQG